MHSYGGNLQTPLSIATSYNQHDIVKLCLKFGTDANKR